MIFFVFIIVDNTRLIGRLGTNFPVPVEVFPVALGRAGNKKIRGYGNYAPAGKRERRTGGDRKHNLVLDVRFRDIGPASEKDHRCRGEWGDTGSIHTVCQIPLTGVYQIPSGCFTCFPLG